MGFTIVTVVRIDVAPDVPDVLLDEFGRSDGDVWDEHVVTDCCPPEIARFLLSERPNVAATIVPQTIRAGPAHGGHVLSTARLSAHWELHDDPWAHGGMTFMLWMASLQSRALLHPDGGHVVVGTYFDPFGAVTEVRASAEGVGLVRHPWAVTDDWAHLASWDEFRDWLER